MYQAVIFYMTTIFISVIPMFTRFNLEADFLYYNICLITYKQIEQNEFINENN